MERCTQAIASRGRLRYTTINQIIKPSITYGMEVWAPKNGCAACSNLEAPLRSAVRAAMDIPARDKMHYQVDLLLHDSNIRALHSDNAAAHVRLAHKFDTLPHTAIQQRARTYLGLPELPAPRYGQIGESDDT